MYKKTKLGEGVLCTFYKTASAVIYVRKLIVHHKQLQNSAS